MTRFGLRGFFLAYPGGSAAVALLLLRWGVGITNITQGAAVLSQPEALTVNTAGVATLMVLSGVLLLFGFRTFLAAMLGGLAIALLSISGLPKSRPHFADHLLSTILLETMTVAVVLLGPGAYSIDARMFGRREIVIPPTSGSH